MLLVGRLPNAEEYKAFREYMSNENTVPDNLVSSLISAVPSPNIMNKLQTVISGLYSVDSDAENSDPVANIQKSSAIISKLPMIVAYAYLAYYKKEANFVKPLANATSAASFLYA